MNDSRFIVILGHDVSRERRVQVKGIDVVKKGTKVLVIFVPGQVRIYPLTGEPKKPVPPPAFRLVRKNLLSDKLYRRTIFSDGDWEIFYTIASQRKSAMWWVDRAENIESTAEALVALERVIKARAFAGELSEEEMTRGWENYQKLVARAFGTDYEGEQRTALRMALKRAMILAGIGGNRNE